VDKRNSPLAQADPPAPVVDFLRQLGVTMGPHLWDGPSSVTVIIAMPLSVRLDNNFLRVSESRLPCPPRFLFEWIVSWGGEPALLPVPVCERYGVSLPAGSWSVPSALPSVGLPGDDVAFGSYSAPSFFCPPLPNER